MTTAVMAVSAIRAIPGTTHSAVEPGAIFKTLTVGRRGMSSSRAWRRRMGAVLGRSAEGEASAKGVEGGLRRGSSMINAAASALVGIQRLDKVPEGHGIMLLLRTHGEALARV
jgi:hypothetical protein